MNEVKESVNAVFEKIQYDSEVLISTLSTKEYIPQSNELKKVFMKYLLQKLERSKNALQSVQTIEDVYSNLNLIEVDYEKLFENLQKQITKLDDGEDISDFIYHLKEESNDLFDKFQLSMKQLIRRR